MFGLVSASAGMHVRNGTFKMRSLIGLESDSVSVSFGYFYLLIREKSLADRAKTKANNDQNDSMSADEPTLNMATTTHR